MWEQMMKIDKLMNNSLIGDAIGLLAIEAATFAVLSFSGLP